MPQSGAAVGSGGGGGGGAAGPRAPDRLLTSRDQGEPGRGGGGGGGARFTPPCPATGQNDLAASFLHETETVPHRQYNVHPPLTPLILCNDEHFPPSPPYGQHGAPNAGDPRYHLNLDLYDPYHLTPDLHVPYHLNPGRPQHMNPPLGWFYAPTVSTPQINAHVKPHPYHHGNARKSRQQSAPPPCRPPLDAPVRIHVKKPLNAFMLYMREKRANVLQESTLRESAAVNRVLGRRWHSLSIEEQSKYYDLALKERQLHMKLYPGWSARDNYGKRKKRRKEKIHEPCK